jgi:hypothetical protein
VDPVPDPVLLRKSGRAGNQTRISGSVARNSGHGTTEAVEVKASISLYTSQISLARSFGVESFFVGFIPQCYIMN